MALGSETSEEEAAEIPRNGMQQRLDQQLLVFAKIDGAPSREVVQVLGPQPMAAGCRSIGCRNWHTKRRLGGLMLVRHTRSCRCRNALGRQNEKV